MHIQKAKSADLMTCFAPSQHPEKQGYNLKLSYNWRLKDSKEPFIARY